MGLFDWLKFKKSTATSSANSWRVGDRVLAKFSDSYFYPGQVRDVQGDSCMVVFDHGDAFWVHHAHVLPPDIKIGSRVFCRARGGDNFFPATVSQQKGETLLVNFDRGDEEWTSFSMVRVQRPIVAIDPNTITGPSNGPVKQSLDLGEPIKDSNWRVGDRVLARFVDFFWYPGTILNMGERGYHVLFDNGDQHVVPDIGLMPLVVEEGEHLFIRSKNEPTRVYTPAVVTHVHGEKLDVELEEGGLETNTRVSRARFWRCPVGVGSFPFEEGDRVLAFDGDLCIYPAEILTIEDEQRVIVQYLDGPERLLTPELVKRFELKPGLKIECRWERAPHFFPGTLSKIDGERIFVKYDDGDEEWTSIRLFRIPPKKPK